MRELKVFPVNQRQSLGICGEWLEGLIRLIKKHQGREEERRKEVECTRGAEKGRRSEESFEALIGIIKSENLPDPSAEIPNRLGPSNYFQSPRGARFPCNPFPGCRAFNSNSLSTMILQQSNKLSREFQEGFFLRTSPALDNPSFPQQPNWPLASDFFVPITQVLTYHQTAINRFRRLEHVVRFSARIRFSEITIVSKSHSIEREVTTRLTKRHDATKCNETVTIFFQRVRATFPNSFFVQRRSKYQRDVD
ncbi:hypothetical protein K0M31_012490 [Melipona bicolor]|uniref:Uncharacterized protein n=1 Tax=Melipona bicolor TaxID=60889 RepID=A0AA40FK59_9HYME|nr:hypothetical protein K0M31_012490 [Melipona bicolor]